MRIAILLIFSALMIACSSTKKEHLLDRTFKVAKVQAVGRLLAARQLAELPEYKNLPLPKIEPTQAPGYLPITANVPPQPWSVSMRYGPGEMQITVEAFGESTSQPIEQKVVELSRTQ
ncbi:hypothetical protein ACPPVV_17725 [Rhodanobacter sp. Col0626]|uniref:hypothetical protein n=1 Tax=Rhodanobacter sp. Col0626 TaxID=3415679 RepID=UPI003CE91A7D